MRQQVYALLQRAVTSRGRLSWNRCHKELSGVVKSASANLLPKRLRERLEEGGGSRYAAPANKYAGSGGGLLMRFDAMLLGGGFSGDPATILTIKGTPPNLRSRLQRRTSGGEIKAYDIKGRRSE